VTVGRAGGESTGPHAWAPAPSALAVVRAVQLRGRAAPPALAAMLTCSEDQVAEALRTVPGALVTETPAGLAVTPTGREWLASELSAEREAVDADGIAGLYDDFEPVDAEVKAVVTSWQLREVDGSGVINDHSDAVYDRAVVVELGRAHTRAVALAERVAGYVGRLWPFPVRLENAHRAVAAGEHRLIAAPMVDSYHTVWFELHEELLHLAGRRRADEGA
jgi:pyruvate, orthophosphate dikinase